MGVGQKQDPDNYSRLRERVLGVLTNFILPKVDVVWFSWEYFEDNVEAGNKVNVAVAAYITIQAWLKLYEYLIKVGYSVLYSDKTLSSSFRG